MAPFFLNAEIQTFIIAILFLLTSVLIALVYALCQQKSKLIEKTNKEKAKLNFRIQLSEKARYGLEKFRMAVENTSEQVFITDPKGEIIYANKACEDITGYTRPEILGKTPALWGRQMSNEFYKNMWHVIATDKRPFAGEVTNKKRGGKLYTAELKITPIVDANNNIAFFVGMERDITKAKEVDRMKTEFISLASHQLRTPLSGMKWLLEILLSEDTGEITPEQRTTLEKINMSNERMISLVNSLLNVSRIESGRIIVDPQPTNLSDLAKDVVTELKMRFEKKRLKVTLQTEDALPQINVDPKLIRHVYLNLITNAIKYTPEGKEIKIYVYQKDQGIIFQIEDQGYGIPKDSKHKIFQKFFRGDNISKKETEGTGLGLYLVKAIVDTSGGKVWFGSEENKGTTFWVSLPLSGSKPKKGEITINA